MKEEKRDTFLNEYSSFFDSLLICLSEYDDGDSAYKAIRKWK